MLASHAPEGHVWHTSHSHSDTCVSNSDHQTIPSLKSVVNKCTTDNPIALDSSKSLHAAAIQTLLLWWARERKHRQPNEWFVFHVIASVDAQEKAWRGRYQAGCSSGKHEGLQVQQRCWRPFCSCGRPFAPHLCQRRCWSHHPEDATPCNGP